MDQFQSEIYALIPILEGRQRHVTFDDEALMDGHTRWGEG